MRKGDLIVQLVKALETVVDRIPASELESWDVKAIIDAALAAAKSA